MDPLWSLPWGPSISPGPFRCLSSGPADLTEMGSSLASRRMFKVTVAQQTRGPGQDLLGLHEVPLSSPSMSWKMKTNQLTLKTSGYKSNSHMEPLKVHCYDRLCWFVSGSLGNEVPRSSPTIYVDFKRKNPAEKRAPETEQNHRSKSNRASER